MSKLDRSPHLTQQRFKAQLFLPVAMGVALLVNDTSAQVRLQCSALGADFVLDK
ncbi:MAG: hypothetical protein I8H71_07100 [Xanthomonadaceae bacterium]|nr:hypothetical protein [Xanthomonadaceae bacterium]